MLIDVCDAVCSSVCLILFCFLDSVLQRNDRGGIVFSARYMGLLWPIQFIVHCNLSFPTHLICISRKVAAGFGAEFVVVCGADSGCGVVVIQDAFINGGDDAESAAGGIGARYFIAGDTAGVLW